MKLGNCEIWCGECDSRREVKIHSVETTDDRSVKVAYTCLHCEKIQFDEYIPKIKESKQ